MWQAAPLDVLASIFGFLDLVSLARTAAVSRRWQLPSDKQQMCWSRIQQTVFGEQHMKGSSLVADGAWVSAKSEASDAQQRTRSLAYEYCARRFAAQRNWKRGTPARTYHFELKNMAYHGTPEIDLAATFAMTPEWIVMPRQDRRALLVVWFSTDPLAVRELPLMDDESVLRSAAVVALRDVDLADLTQKMQTDTPADVKQTAESLCTTPKTGCG